VAELIWEGKYKTGPDGRQVKQGPLRVVLPFQTVETVNESAQERQKGLDLFATGAVTEWRNRLIWGDKKYVLPSLLADFAGKVDLIYIDPPFDTGANFSFSREIPDAGSEVEYMPNAIEQKAYRDTWGAGIDSYVPWFYDTVVLLRELLSPTGSIFVHLDWHVGHYARAVLDEVFGTTHFVNEVIWWYYNKFQGNVKRFASDHDVIFWYSKGDKFQFEPQFELREKAGKQIVRTWDKEKGRIVNAKGADGKVVYQESTHRMVDDVWRISMLQPADLTENLRYPTQKPEVLVERLINAASRPGDLVLDCFCGSGTTPAVAEKRGRRWIACDLGRFAIQTTRKRLLGIEGVKPFVVQNLGKYERQQWQVQEFGEDADAKLRAYRKFILDLYRARELGGKAWLHGVKGGRMVHVGSVDSPISVGDVQQIAKEFKQSVGTGADAPTGTGVDVLGWDFAFDLNETARNTAREAGIDVRFVVIPREVLEKKAVEQGDIHFYELAALTVNVTPPPGPLPARAERGRKIAVELTDFIMSLDDVPDDVQRAVKHWSQWIDYWAVDFDFKGDTFHNQWQSYRTRKEPKLNLKTEHTYEAAGTYTVMVKVIDILGNDTTKTVKVEVK